MKRFFFILASGIWILASGISHAVLDTNNNGLSDLWEREFNDGSLFDEFFDPQADPDGDGWTNAQEAAAGTDPFDPNPPDGIIRPEIVHTPAVWGVENGVQVLVSPEVVTVSWPTIPGKRYHLLVSADLSQGSWIEVPDSDFIGNGNIPEFHFTTAESDKLFWRVAVSDTDSDGDGLTDAEEAMLGTNAHGWDSDGDGLADLDEVLNGYSPLIGDEDANGVPDGWDDSDMDGYSDLEELAAGTDPRNPLSKPDGVSTDTLLVRNATVSVTQVGARGSKDFAFREFSPASPDGNEGSGSLPKFFLTHANADRRGETYAEDRDIETGDPEIEHSHQADGANEEESAVISTWARGTPAQSNTAALPYQLTEDLTELISRSISYRHFYTPLAPPQQTDVYSYSTGDPPEDYFNFQLQNTGDESYWNDAYTNKSWISTDSTQTRETAEAFAGQVSWDDEDQGSFSASFSQLLRSSVSLSDEYTDGALAADVNEALTAALTAAAGGTSPGITGSASISGRGIADHQWSADHITHLKMNSKVKLSTTVTQSGVRKVVFLWSELLRPDPATPGDAGPAAKLKIRRVTKTSASTYAPGSTVDTGEIAVLHPAEPGYIEIPGPSGVDAPDRLQITPGSHSSNPPFLPLAPLHVHSSLPDRGIPVTLESTGDAQIRIWKEQNGSFSQVTLPYTLGADQKAGQISRPASLHIQGLAPGTARLALKAQGQEITFKSVGVFDFDLDADSDNSGQVDATTSEDGIECTAEDPGVIVSPNGDGDEDSDGTPNRNDMDNAGEFTPIRISLANLAPSDRVIFRYSAAELGSQSASGGLRLWKKNGTSARSASDMIQSGGQGYTAANLGVSGGSPATLYLEAVSDLGGPQVISVETPGASDAVKIFPLTLQSVSRDKYLAGSFEIPAGWNDLSAEFVNTSSQENLGTYGNLTGGGTTKIYDSVDDIMNDADILAGSQPATQKVWFIRNAGNPRKLDFYTCFNSIGTVEIRLSSGGQTVLTRSHPLTAAEDFAETIRYVDDWVKGVGFEFSGGDTPPLPMGAPTMNGFGGGEGGIDNLTRAALIPFFNVINQVEGLQNIAVGLFDGVKAGLNDDWQLLLLVKSGAVTAGGWAWQHAETELLEWKNNPVKRAGELKDKAMKVCKEWVFEPLKEKRRELSTWVGFKNESWKVWKSVQGTAAKAWTVTRNSWGDICTGFSSWMDDFGARMIEGAEKTHWSENVFSMTKFQQIGNAATITGCYALGYSTGYIAEQVAIGVVTGGVVKVGAVLTKGGVKMAGLLAARRVLPVAARLQLVKKWAASVAVSIEMKVAIERGLAASAEMPLSAILRDSVAEVIERGMARAAFARTVFTTGHILDEAILALNIRKLILTPGREEQFWHKFALFFDVMEDKATAEASKGWVKAYDRLLKFNGNILADDRAGDFHSLLRTGTAEGKSAAKKSLEEFSGTDGTGKLWLRDVEKIQAEGYRYSNFDPRFDRDGNLIPGAPKLKPTDEPLGGWYTSFDKFDAATDAKSLIQLPPASTAKYRLEFDYAAVKDNVRIARGDQGQAEFFELLCRDFPAYGIGGATQNLVEGVEIPIKAIWDISGITPIKVYP